MPLTNKTALAITENEDISDTFIQTLRVLNCHKRVLKKNPTEAIQELKNNDFDFILCDSTFTTQNEDFFNILTVLSDKNNPVSVIIYADNVLKYRAKILQISSINVSIELIQQNEDGIYLIIECLKKMIKDHECGYMKAVTIPGLIDKLEALEKKNFGNFATEYFKDVMISNKEKIGIALSGSILVAFAIIEGYLTKLKNLLIG